MDRIIPILPCQSIKDQVAFYEQLGFTTHQISNLHGPYAVLSYGAIVIHFYGSKRTVPGENATMCYVEVDDVDRVYEKFTSNYKQANGKIPRSGIPRISKLKDLVEDRRFTVTDTGGNTLYVGTPHTRPTESAFYRNVEDASYAKHFEIVYDLMYSKEECQAAYNMLTKFFPEDLTSIEMDLVSLAKILLVALDIHMQRSRIIHPEIDGKLQELFRKCDMQLPEWNKLHRRYIDIVAVE